MLNEASKYVETLETDGFVVFRDFFDARLVSKARAEIQNWYDIDRKEREAKGISAAVYAGGAGKTILTSPTHLMLDVYAKSPTLDQLFEKILTDPTSSTVLEALAGGNLKMRGYNIKKMTGNLDSKPKLGPAAIPHEWHRDSPAEICIAIFLDDFSAPDNGTTAIMKGTHKLPYCPRWNCLFGPNYLLSKLKPLRFGISSLLRLTLFSRLLARKLAARATGAYGKRGDFYIFINDVWHGREPNVWGNANMMLMAGAFPAERSFPDQVDVPPSDVLQGLPPTLRAVASQALPGNSNHETIINRMLDARANLVPKGLFYLAQFERRMAEAISASLFFIFRK